MIHVSIASFPGLHLKNLAYSDNSTPLTNIVNDIRSQIPPSISNKVYISFASGKPLPSADPSVNVFSLNSSTDTNTNTNTNNNNNNNSNSNSNNNNNNNNINIISNNNGKDKAYYLSFRINARLCGGKGGFGSQLRAQGGRMSSSKKNSNSNSQDSMGQINSTAQDAYRTLQGRRMRSIRQAKDLAAYLEQAPIKAKAISDAKKEKLLKIINTPTHNPANLRFNDIQYLETSQDVVDNVNRSVRLVSTNVCISTKALLSTNVQEIESLGGIVNDNDNDNKRDTNSDNLSNNKDTNYDNINNNSNNNNNDNNNNNTNTNNTNNNNNTNNDNNNNNTNTNNTNNTNNHNNNTNNHNNNTNNHNNNTNNHNNNNNNNNNNNTKDDFSDDAAFGSFFA